MGSPGSRWTLHMVGSPGCGWVHQVVDGFTRYINQVVVWFIRLRVGLPR